MAGFVRIRQVESRPNLSFGRTLRLSSDRHDLIVCREAEQRQNNVLHAVIKMVEAFFKLTHRCRLTGGGIKPPEGALVKSQGAERSG